MRKIFSLLIILMYACAAHAATPDGETPDVLDMRLDENLATPEVPRKAQAYVTTAIDQLRRHIAKGGLSVKPMRNGEVLEIVIPCATLFAPGSLEVKPSAPRTLAPLTTVVREPRKYKVLVAVHSDDTGDTQYADSITAARANSIDDCLWQLANEKDTNVIPYGIGKDEPLGPNTSRNSREANRRVEIYIVPDRGLLELAGVKFKDK